MANKLHQILAVEPDLEGKYKRIAEESKKTFSKSAMFTGSHRKLVSFEENAPEFPEEYQEIATTVDERIAYTNESIANYLDALLQKEATNQIAKADLEIDGVVLAKDVPATFLLALETRLKFIRGVYESIPTLPAGIEWSPASDKGIGIWKMVHPEEKLKTELKFKSQILVPPTEHHPAQVEKWQEQVPVGKFVKNIWSGMITSARKSELLDRIDRMLQAAKNARQKANSVGVINVKIGKALTDFITN